MSSYVNSMGNYAYEWGQYVYQHLPMSQSVIQRIQPLQHFLTAYFPSSQIPSQRSITPPVINSPSQVLTGSDYMQACANFKGEQDARHYEEISDYQNDPTLNKLGNTVILDEKNKIQMTHDFMKDAVRFSSFSINGECVYNQGSATEKDCDVGTPSQHAQKIYEALGKNAVLAQNLMPFLNASPAASLFIKSSELFGNPSLGYMPLHTGAVSFSLDVKDSAIILKYQIHTAIGDMQQGAKPMGHLSATREIEIPFQDLLSRQISQNSKMNDTYSSFKFES